MLNTLYFIRIQNIYFYLNIFIHNIITVATPSNENANILPTSNKIFFDDLRNINNIFFWICGDTLYHCTL